MPDPNKLKLAKEHGRSEILLSVALVPETSRVFVGASDGKVYDIADVLADKLEPRELTGHQSYVTGLALAGETLISGSYDGQLIWWNIASGEKTRSIAAAHAKWIRKLAISPSGELLASVGDDMVCRVWNVASGERLHELRGHDEQTPHHFPSMLYACAFSPDGTKLATVDRVGTGIVWEVASGEKLAQVVAPALYTWDPTARIHSIGGARSVTFSPDGKLLAIGGMGQVGNIDHLEGKSHLDIFDWQAQRRTHEFPGDQFKGLTEQMIFAPDGKWLVALGGDNGGWAQIYDMETKKVLKQEKAPTHIHAAVADAKLDTIVAAGHGKLMVWTLS
jgi:WD40 repeat protein